MQKKPLLSLIAAVSKNGVIGREQALPWHIPEDLKYFKEKTYGAPVIMGRKTYESVGRLLPGRKNVIITRSEERIIPGAYIVSSFEKALEVACEGNGGGGVPNEVFVVGGEDIYRLALPYADRVYITEIDLTVENGDAYFPEWPALPGFREISRVERASSEDGKIPSFRFLVFEREK